MKISVVGLNHKTAPVAIREQLAFDSQGILNALRHLKSKFSHAEFVLVSTCNRVELYTASRLEDGVGFEDMVDFLAEFHGIKSSDFKDYLYIYNDEEAVKHLLTVVSSLDSMIVGERQITGQVKESYRLACKAKATGKVLNRLFHRSFAVAKKIHTNTLIANGHVGVGSVVVELVMQLFPDMSAARVVLIGAGEMGELIIQNLLDTGCKNISVINRTYERCVEIADKYRIAAKRWDELEEQLLQADIIIASAGGQDYLFKKKAFKEVTNRRRKGDLLVIDIAVPRNIEPTVNDIEGVYLYNIDELSELAEQNLKNREEDIARGMQIVCDSVSEFMEWFRYREIGPLIGQMREKFSQISRNELEKFFVGPRKDASCKDVMVPMVNRLVNKLLHCVIKNVNTVAKEQGSTKAADLVDSIVQQAEEITSETDKKETNLKHDRGR